MRTRVDFGHDESAAYMNARLTRVYRFYVEIRIEGDEPPPIEELAEHVATQVQDEDDHDLAVCVRAIETQDFYGIGVTDVPLTKGVS